MKKLITLALIGISFSSFAGPDSNGSAPILPALKKHFTEAKEMQWVGGDDVVKIEFSFNNQSVYRIIFQQVYQVGRVHHVVYRHDPDVRMGRQPAE